MPQQEINRLIQAILAERFPDRYSDEWLAGVSAENDYQPYQAIVLFLKELDEDPTGIVSLSAILSASPLSAHPHFAGLSRLMERALVFDTNEIPPTITDINRVGFDEEYVNLSTVVDGDYQSRVTTAFQDEEFEKLKGEALNALAHIYASFPDKARYNLPVRFNELLDKDLDRVIKHLDKIEKQEEKGKIQQTETLKRSQKISLDFFKLIKQVRHLTPLRIPRESSELTYCELAEATVGVTQKTSLISMPVALERLAKLATLIPEPVEYEEFLEVPEEPAWQRYLLRRKDVKLGKDAHIKFPKASAMPLQDPKKTEVQREHIALNIARLLHPNVTQSTMLMHDDKPCLFVPFDKVTELKEYASGRVNRKYGVGGKYFVDSTFSPVGEGVYGVSTELVEDFGDCLAYCFLASDPDAIGGYNQNKALINGKHFYIFDQVIMASNHFKLDGSLSLIPCHSTSRHLQGRNRSLLEDNSFDKKFEGLVRLYESSGKIDAMFRALIDCHTAQYEALEEKRNTSGLTAAESAKLDELKLLAEDASTLWTKCRERCDEIQRQLFIPGLDRSQTKQTLLLQKLLNRPVLYNDLGRPYRFPFTDKHAYKVQQVKQVGERYKITFNRRPPPEAIDYLNFRLGLHGNGETMAIEESSVLISASQLALLTEGMLFPEHAAVLDMEEDYLKRNELRCLEYFYPPVEGSAQVFGTIAQYQTLYPTLDNPKKAQVMGEIIDIVDAKLQQLEEGFKCTNPGLLLHLKRKLQFDQQQKIIELCPTLMEHTEARVVQDKLHQAFQAAMKLDRVDEFQKVCRKALKTGKLNDRLFKGYLDCCINHANDAKGYDLAKRHSRHFADRSECMLECLDRPTLAVAETEVEEEHVEQAIQLEDLGISAAEVADVVLEESEEVVNAAAKARVVELEFTSSSEARIVT